MTADMKVRTAICEFINHFNTYPNKIIMGYNLVEELHRQFIGSLIPLRETEKELGKLKCMYENIPIDIDYDNPNNLEIGYMVKWIDSKYC